METKKITMKTSKIAEQGTVIDPKDQRLANGKVNLAPTAGYDGHYPVQFSDETDETFAARVAMFEDSYATAQVIEAGGMNIEASKKALQAKFDADIAALETQHDDFEANRKETTKVAEEAAKREAAAKK